MPLNKLKEQLTELEKKHRSALNGFAADANSAFWTEQVQCTEHGEFTQHNRKLTGLGGRMFHSKTECPHCIAAQIAEVKQKIADVEARQRTMLIASLQRESGISSRFAEVNFDNYHTTVQNGKAKRTCQAYAEKWLDRKAKGGGLVLCGKPGTGKNHLACAIAHHVINEHQDSVFITTAMRIIRKVKSTWERKAELSEAEVLEFYCEKDLLIIDEIGVQFGTESELIILFEIINERYEQMRPTILISNLSESELAKYIGERVIDRMREGQGAVISFDWESYRK